MSTSTISSTITDASGAAVVGARVVCRLVPAPAFRTADGSEIDPVVETVTDSSGNWSLVLEETASISPSNTNYEVVEYLPSGPRKHTIQVGASDQSLFAALVTPPPAADGNAYLTQASADARYQALGGGFGSVVSVGTALSAGVSTSAARADHVHDLANGSIDAAALLADGILTQAKMASGLRVPVVGTAAPGGIAEGDPWVHTSEKRLYVYDGSASQRVGHYTSAGRTGGIWTRATNQSISNVTDTTVTFTAETADSDGFLTPTSGTITIPSGLGGWYAYQFRGTLSGSPTATAVRCLVNGTTNVDNRTIRGSDSAIAISGTILLAAGDTFVVQVFQSSGGALNLNPATLNFVRLAV